MMVQLSGMLAVLVAGASLVQAHPGDTQAQKRAELNARNEYIRSLANTDLVHCAGKLTRRGEVQRIVERREAILKTLRRKRGLDVNEPHYRVKRQAPGPKGQPGFGSPGMFGPKLPTVLPEPLMKSHKSASAVPGILKADWALLGQNRTTVLSPEVTEGPFYASGGWIRKNVRENEKGVDLHLDIQVVDMNTCTPMQNQAVEIWAANAVGVYSNVLDFMNPGDQNNVNNRALRGIQLTDQNGAVQFETIIPGHYSGRTNHIHVANHLNAVVHPNNTISGGTVPHIGQLYFDEDLIDAVTASAHYQANKFVRLRNREDFLMIQGAGGGSDPIVEYVLLGKDIKDGVFAWINFGVNPKQNRPLYPATVCAAEGCKNSLADMSSAFGQLGKFIGGLGAAFGGAASPKPAGNWFGAAPKGN